MAINHLFAFSASVDGAGIAAGSPYGCSATRGGPGGKCYYGGVDIAFTIEYVLWRYSQGLIDDPKNLNSTPVLLFNGKNDWTVYVQEMRDTKQQLLTFIRPGMVAAVFNTEAAHVWSLDHGLCQCGDCAFYGSSVECCDVNNCGYDMTGDMLGRFYGPLKPRTPARNYLSWVSQLAYVPAQRTWRNTGLDNWALVYVPTGCRSDPSACRLHIHYHGCIVNQWPRRKKWSNLLDLNEYGESNDIIVLYPQARGTQAAGWGCWNWGFPQDDELFDTAQSVQLRTVANMAADLPNALHHALELPVGTEPPTSGALKGVMLSQSPDAETPRLESSNMLEPLEEHVLV